MNNFLDFNTIDSYLKLALKEDIPHLDISSHYILDNHTLASCDLICKEDGILCGLPVFQRIFELFGNVSFENFFSDGDIIHSGDLICKIKSSALNILSAERTALNYLQRMSGISTLTNNFIFLMNKKSKTKLLDTRKTTPNMRIFEKYAVRVGGGRNHRFNLSDGVMLKDNHIQAAGSIFNAVNLTRSQIDITKKIEVEVESLDMVIDALEAKADIIMLDNMDIPTMKTAINLIQNNALIEISGNISLDTIYELSSLNADFISCGALTHSAKILDFSLKNLKLL